VPRLRPGAALADLAKYGASLPDPEDLDLEALDADEQRLLRRLAGKTELVRMLRAAVLR